MKITGPDWPSTAALAEALANVAPAEFTLRWGQRTHNGWEQLVAFAAADVPCPLATNSLEEAKAFVRQGGRLWGRNLDHTQGTDIVGAGYSRSAPIRNGTFREVSGLPVVGFRERWNHMWEQRDFWVQPIDTADEYRQHVWAGKCIRVGKKVQTEQPSRILPVRSRKNGWTLDYGAKVEDKELRDRIRTVAKDAVTALGYVGGAVDIVVDRSGAVYVLEVNTAPALRDENTLRAYVQAISTWAVARA